MCDDADIFFKVVACIGAGLGGINTIVQWMDRRRILTVHILSHKSDDDRGAVRVRITNPSRKEIHVRSVRLMAYFTSETRWGQVDEQSVTCTRPIPGVLPPESSSDVAFNAHDTFGANLATAFRVEVETEAGKVFRSRERTK